MENLKVIAPNVAWVSSPSATPRAEIPCAEVVAKKPRRGFSIEYKLRILRELDACQSGKERGLILRREGLYSSTVSNWKKQYREGVLNKLGATRGRKSEDPHIQRITELEKENKELQNKLKQAEIILDVQKKVSEMFGTSVSENTRDDQQ